jgi:hypothetical protein
MKEFAEKLYNWGFNVYGVNKELNENNFNDNNKLKAPFTTANFADRQSSNDFNSINWNEMVGYGAFLGYNSLCAIDIDGVIDIDTINLICDKLEIPHNYEWIIKSGSQCGYHILLKCKLPIEKISKASVKQINAPQETEPFEFGTIDTNAYYQYENYYGLKHLFYKIEFKWDGNIILPPSLHQSGNNYIFINGIPNKEPITVNFQKLKEVSSLGSTQAKSSVFSDFDGVPYSQTSYLLSFSDSIPYNFQIRTKEEMLIFNISQYTVHNSTIHPLLMNQISWFVTDKNSNILKRQCFNYYSNKIHSELHCNTIDIEIANKIINNSRFVYHEFLFDLLHVKEILCYDLKHIEIVKSEITDSGLYHDSFLKKMSFSEKTFECEIIKEYTPEEQLKPIKSVNEVIFNYKKKLNKYKLDSNKNFANEMKIKLEKISALENKLNNYKHVNSISYLTILYTLYLSLD